jgi:hypothetical protein
MLKQMLTSLVIALALPVVPALAQAQPPNVVTRVSTTTATVERIEKSPRLLTLRAPENMMQTVYVDPSIKAFDDLKVGDVITVRYQESVVVQVRPGAALSGPRDTTEEARKAGGENITGQQKVIVTVDSIDSQGQLISYRTADNMRAVRYVADKSLIQGLRAGDRIEVTLTRERATSIERARR